MFSSTERQRGTFTVEFALVGLIFSLMLVFTGDLVEKLAIHGKLDRMSFSAVSVIKERTQFTDRHEVLPLKQDEVEHLYQVILSSLSRTVNHFVASKFGMTIEEQRFDSNDQPLQMTEYYPSTHGNRCNVGNKLSHLQSLSLKSSWGRRFTLYQVTLCYETDNWFGDLVGETFNHVSSSSLIMGR